MANAANFVEMRRVEAPRMIRFATGEAVEGVLMGRERITVSNKPVIRYTVKESDGELVTFLGTADLITKLRADFVGHLIRVKCIGEDTMVKRGDNCMKVFEVDVSVKPVGNMNAATVSAVDGLEITDDDIPF